MSPFPVNALSPSVASRSRSRSCPSSSREILMMYGSWSESSLGRRITQVVAIVFAVVIVTLLFSPSRHDDSLRQLLRTATKRRERHIGINSRRPRQVVPPCLLVTMADRCHRNSCSHRCQGKRVTRSQPITTCID